VDGTLYNQSMLRIIMTVRSLLDSIIHPLTASRNIKVIKSYRDSQETLREKKEFVKDLAVKQIKITSGITNVDEKTVKEIVNKWFETVPLKFIPFCKRKDLTEIFEWLKNNNYKVGLYSDYDSHDKAKALKLEKYIDVYLSSMDSEVGVFKPDPKGFALASLKLGFPAENILYVGDRFEVDVVGANAAGMKAVLIGSQLPSNDKYNYEIKSMSELKNILQKENS
ncbi:MAG: HAD family hydrolase, partial [Ignavibacteria bacterium]|nr:HAD family hydrolase [Ignavibacteria bacterium]